MIIPDVRWLARFLFENSPFADPFWSAWCVGYCVVEMDGRIYLTEAGQDYLERVAA